MLETKLPGVVILASMIAASCAPGAATGPRARAGTGAGPRTFEDPLYPSLGDAGVDVLAVDVFLDLTGEELVAVADLELVLTEPRSSFSLDLVGLEVKRVELGGESAEYEHAGGKLVITGNEAFAAGRVMSLEVAYGGVPAPIPTESAPVVEGVGWIDLGDEVVVASVPVGAPSFVPCNDHPSDVATWEISVRPPEGRVVFASGAPVEADVERKVKRFVVRQPVAAQRIGLAIGAYEVVELTTGIVPVRLGLAPGIDGEVRGRLDAVPAMIAFFSERFGRYPFETFNVVVTNFPQRVSFDCLALAVFDARAADEASLAHEVAAQWFGGVVGLDSWSDAWLSVSLAQYAAWMWLESRGGPEALEACVRHGRRLAEGAAAPGAIGVTDLFGASLFGRGPLAAHALRGELGGPMFDDLLRRWVQRHAGDTASLRDFYDLADEVAGRSVRGLLNEWLFGAELPAASD